MEKDKKQLFEEVNKIKNDLVCWRRDFHQHPELGLEEERTAKIVADLLNQWGIETKTGISKTGVIGIIKGEGNGNKTIALRADMDALPMQETNDIPYKSKIAGKMHACGHDGHTSILLGVAKVLSENKKYINGNVKLLFQPAEEGPGGAYPMIEEGALDDVDSIFGLHLTTAFSTGKIGINMKESMASTDVFEITMIGKGGHAGSPHDAVDALSMGARVYTEIQNMVSRNIDPTEPLVVSVGTLHGGEVSNVIAETCKLTGTIRTYNENLRPVIIDNIKRISEGIAYISGGKAEVNIIPGLPPLINDLNSVKLVLDSAKDVFDEKNILILEKPSMGAEDFAYYLKKIPGAFIWLGARNEEKGFINYMHNPNFDFDEEALVYGAKMLINLTLDYLNKKE